jgi:hypothetical protein
MGVFKNTVKVKKGDKPNLPARLFWDSNFDKIDWQKESLAVIDRVIDRGNNQDWAELIRFYGKSTVVKALKSEIKYLPDYAIESVCSYFKLKKEELACYARTQLKRGHWI